MALKKIALAAALVSASVSAMAVTYTIGTLPTAPSVYSNVLTEAPGAFSDIFNFTFPAFSGGASGTVASLSIGSFNIANLNLSIYTSANALVVSDGTGTSSSLSNVSLTPGGSYYFKVTGTASGAAGGLYSMVASAAAVPEPQTYALMLAGVGMVGFLAFRRGRDRDRD